MNYDVNNGLKIRRHDWSSQLYTTWAAVKLKLENIMSSYLSPQFKYIIFHIFICNVTYDKIFLPALESQYVTQSFVISVVFIPLQLDSLGTHVRSIVNSPPAPSHLSAHSPSFAFQPLNSTPKTQYHEPGESGQSQHLFLSDRLITTKLKSVKYFWESWYQIRAFTWVFFDI